MDHREQVKERAVVLGPAGSLVGVWSEPRSGGTHPIAVVLLNSGVIHHVGASRLHVRLARTLAREGVATLRFDLSGIGDSRNLSGAATLDDLIREDVDAAIDYALRRHGVSGVVLGGLCSGAKDAIDAAGRGTAVRGIICIDLIADFRTWQHHALHYSRRVFRWESWVNTLRGKNQLVQRAGAALMQRDLEGQNAGALATLGLRPIVERTELARIMDGFLKRGGQALFLFSGGLENNYNHRSQFRRALPTLASQAGMSFDYFPDADHTFRNATQQAALVSRINDWFSEITWSGDLSG